jgi:expansin (peptidoglycan-binding protein)
LREFFYFKQERILDLFMKFMSTLLFAAISLCLAEIDLDAGIGNGRITYYEQSAAVACDIPQSEWPMHTAALDEPHFQGGLACGATARLQNEGKEIQVMVVDLCPTAENQQWCSGDMTHFDLGGTETFSLLEPVITGVKELQYEWLPTPVGDSPVKIRFKDGVNPWWVAIQVINHRYPVANLELQDPVSGEWLQGDRTLQGMWNYWKFDFSGNIRITDQYGQVIEETGSVLQEQYMWEGANQFPLLARHGGTNAGKRPRRDTPEGIRISQGNVYFGNSVPLLVEVADLRGITAVLHRPQGGQSFTLPRHLSPGVYLVKVHLSHRYVTMKYAVPGLFLSP